MKRKKRDRIASVAQTLSPPNTPGFNNVGLIPVEDPKVEVGRKRQMGAGCRFLRRQTVSVVL